MTRAARTASNPTSPAWLQLSFSTMSNNFTRQQTTSPSFPRSTPASSPPLRLILLLTMSNPPASSSQLVDSDIFDNLTLSQLAGLDAPAVLHTRNASDVCIRLDDLRKPACCSGRGLHSSDFSSEKAQTDNQFAPGRTASTDCFNVAFTGSPTQTLVTAQNLYQRSSEARRFFSMDVGHETRRTDEHAPGLGLRDNLLELLQGYESVLLRIQRGESTVEEELMRVRDAQAVCNPDAGLPGV